MNHINNRYLIDIDGEQWRDIVGYDGIYNISNLGRVKSIGRYVIHSHGGQKWIKEKILKQHISKRYGEPNVKLSQYNIAKTFRVAILVGDAFLSLKNKNEEYCHLNKDKLDNRLCNLIVTTCSNSQVISYQKGNIKNWGIEKIPKANKAKYEKEKCFYENGVLIKKECVKCGKILSVKDFYTKENCHVRRCKKCQLKDMGVKNIGKYIQRKRLAEQGYRYCSVCKKLKKLDTDFGKSRSGYLGKSNNCKECVRELNAKYRKRQLKLT